jgi:hypothetical protein
MKNGGDDLTTRNGVVANIVAKLAAGQFAQIEQLTLGRRLSAGDMRKAVASYGRTLLVMPPDAVGLIDYIRISSESAWSVVAPLHTAEEGLSDLSLEMTLRESGPGTYDIEIDNIHVR